MLNIYCTLHMNTVICFISQLLTHAHIQTQGKKYKRSNVIHERTIKKVSNSLQQLLILNICIHFHRWIHTYMHMQIFTVCFSGNLHKPCSSFPLKQPDPHTATTEFCSNYLYLLNTYTTLYNIWHRTEKIDFETMARLLVSFHKLSVGTSRKVRKWPVSLFYVQYIAGM